MAASPFAETTPVHSREFGPFGGIRRRIVVSLAATVGWLCLVLLYLAFWASGFSLFQSIVLVIVSLLVLAAILLGS